MKIFASIIALFLLAYSCAALAEEKLEHSINVNGIGQVEAAVDNVMIDVSINTRDKVLKTAKEESEKRYNSLLSVIQEVGLDKSSIKSNFVSVNPVYVPCYPTDQNPHPKCDATKIDYYDLNRNVAIKLDKLEKYDDLISQLSEGGGTHVNTGQYGVTNISKYRDEARDLAIDAAHGKAEKVAKKLNVPLGKPIHFESYDDTPESPRPMLMRAKVANAMMAESAPVTDTETMGKIKVTVNVSIAYGIE